MSDDELMEVPLDADEDFDPGYEPVEDPDAGNEGHEADNG